MPGLPLTLPGPAARTEATGAVSAPFFDDDDIEAAAAAALKGVMAVLGLAARSCQYFAVGAEKSPLGTYRAAPMLLFVMSRTLCRVCEECKERRGEREGGSSRAVCLWRCVGYVFWRRLGIESERQRMQRGGSLARQQPSLDPLAVTPSVVYHFHPDLQTHLHDALMNENFHCTDDVRLSYTYRDHQRKSQTWTAPPP